MARFMGAGRAFLSDPDVSLALYLYLGGGESQHLLLNLVPKDNPADLCYLSMQSRAQSLFFL